MKKIYLDIKYGNKHTKGYILDISKIGIAIASRTKLRKNMAIQIFVKRRTSLSFKGRIISCVNRKKKNYNYRLGIKFISLGRIEKGRLDKFLHNLIYLKREKRKSVLTFI